LHWKAAVEIVALNDFCVIVPRLSAFSVKEPLRVPDRLVPPWPVQPLGTLTWETLPVPWNVRLTDPPLLAKVPLIFANCRFFLAALKGSVRLPLKA
jgi:hypothetical protein